MFRPWPPFSLVPILGFTIVNCAVISAQQLTTIDHPLPSYASHPEGITNGPDGALWFTEITAAKIGRITLAGVVTEFPLPSGAFEPEPITAGPDGALWFGLQEQVGRITTAGAVTLFPLPGSGNDVFSITPGPDGALWFTVNNASGEGFIGRITTAGNLTLYPFPTLFAGLGSIVSAQDGALWFTEEDTGSIGRITTAGDLTEYAAMGSPSEMTIGPDGALWFVEIFSNTIGRMTLSGVVTGFPVGDLTPSFITLGPDGALWFTQEYSPVVGRLTTGGLVTSYPIPNEAVSIVTGRDRALWFTEENTGRIGQLVSATASLAVSPVSGVAGTPITLSGSGFGDGETVNIYMDSVSRNLAFSASADFNGEFTISGNLRPAPLADQSFVAVGQSTSKLAVSSFNVEASLRATPREAAAGDTIQLSGFGYGGSEAVLCGFAKAAKSATSTNALGSFTNLEYTIPSGTAPGVQAISCVGLSPFAAAEISVDVE